MAITAKNINIGVQKEEVITSSEPPVVNTWGSISRTYVPAPLNSDSLSKTYVPSTPNSPIKPDSSDNYVKIFDGDLEKHYNKRSEYLVDMAAIDFK